MTCVKAKGPKQNTTKTKQSKCIYYIENTINKKWLVAILVIKFSLIISRP